jgi:hypothetical protein
VATPRVVRIPRSRTSVSVVRVPIRRPEGRGTPGESTRERRPNTGGTQRAVRLALLFVVTLALLYTGFVLYDRSAPGGTAPPQTNGLLEFTGFFLAIGAGGAAVSLTSAPRAVEVGPDRVIVVGRWGRRRTFPRLDMLSIHVVHRYPVSWLAETPVDVVELWGEDTPRRSYLMESELLRGAKSTPGGR